jgi:hypothetical protein
MTNRYLTPLFAAAILVVGAFALPAMAQPEGADGRPHGNSDRPDRPDRPDREYCSPENIEGNDTRAAECERVRGNRGPDREHGRQVRELRERCLAEEPEDDDADGNVTDGNTTDGNVTGGNVTDSDGPVDGNETEEDSDGRRCDRIREAHEHGNMARREAHAILHAIAAHQRRYERLNATEADLEARLADGNLTENETLRAQHRLERIDSHQNRTQEQIDHLQAVLERLRARWDEVREHVDERRMERDERREGRGHDEDDSDEGEGDDAEAGGSDDSDEAEDADEDVDDDADEDAEEDDAEEESDEDESEEEDLVTP